MNKSPVKNYLVIAIRAVLLGTPVLCSLIPSTSYAAATQNFSINKNTLDQVLRQLAIQSGLTISYDANQFSKIQSAGLKGSYSKEEALNQVLSPHQLKAKKLTNGGYIIQTDASKGSIEPRMVSLSPLKSSGSNSALNGTSEGSSILPTITLSANNKQLSTEDTGLYTAKATTAATGLALSLKETPQLVSVITRQQMDDQHLVTLTDVATQAAGLTINQGGSIGSDNTPIYSRGQQVDNYLLDNVKLVSSYSSIFQSQDTALYDRFEVVRGATGLMTGAGTASASINMIRKKPLQDFKASVGVSAGSWDTYRADVDVSSPLTESGNVRGRTVLAYQDGNSYIDRYSEKRKIAYGVIEADLAEKTKASLGISYQQIDISGIGRSGLPSYYTDGSLINWSRSDSSAASWSYSNRKTVSYFADIEHAFNERWKLKGIASRTTTTSDERVGYAYSYNGIDPQTGAGAMIYATRWDYEPKQNLFNLTLNGSFDLFNQTHDLVFGATYTKSKNQRPSYSGWNNNMTWDGDLDNIFNWNGNIPSQPANEISGWYGSDETSKSVFGVIRFKPTDDLALILGTRVEDWERVAKEHSNAKNTTTITPHKETGEVVPYFGLTYDLTNNWTTYISYTKIFLPQDKKTVTGEYIDPVTGNSTEIGIKGEFLDNQLNVGAALYQTKEDNKAIALDTPALDGSTVYRAESGTKSKGFELEATGKITNDWQISTSFTRNLSKDNKGKELDTKIPNNTAKLFTTYTLPYFDQALMVGGGVRWQSEIYSLDTRTAFTHKFVQSSYALVDLMARYKINKNLLINFNLNNLFNKKYHLATTNSYYGAPINFTASVKYSW